MPDFEKVKRVDFPRTVVVGHDALDRVAGVVADLGYAAADGGPATAAVVADAITRKVAGDRVEEALGEAGFSTVALDIEAATDEEVERVRAEAVDEAGADVLLGVGGGTVIDVAKLASFRAGRPFLSVPTSAAHDGICSPRASIKDRQGSSSEPAHVPVGVVADTAVIVEAPYRMLAAGCADAISNLTAVMDWELARRVKGEEFSASAATLSRTSAEMVLDHADIFKPGVEEAAWVLVKALIISGVAMSVAGSSRPASGAEHLFSHTLDRIAPEPAMHGEQVGVGSVLSMHLHGRDHRPIRDALDEIGAPTTAEGLGMDRDLVVRALTEAHALRPERYTILGDKGLTRKAAEEAVEATGVA